jgi:putative thioredoxin
MTTDVTTATFDAEVLQASRTQPVVVDFWAPWCGPCHQLAPVLERVAGRYADDVRLVKLNVDDAPELSQRYGIRGIPAVKAFRHGAVAAEFVGVQPEPAIDRFFAALAPTAADRAATRAEAAQDPAAREALLREALAEDPAHRGAILALAALLAERGDAEEARSLLERVPPDEEVRVLLARLALAGTDGGADLDGLRGAAEGGDAGAALQLGTALAAQGAHAEAVEHLLAAVADPEHREPAREALLAVFAVAGEGSDLVRGARRRLASALF